MKRSLFSLLGLGPKPAARKKRGGGASADRQGLRAKTFGPRPSGRDLARFRALWAMKLDTLAIAAATGFPEAAVYNALFVEAE